MAIDFRGKDQIEVVADASLRRDAGGSLGEWDNNFGNRMSGYNP